MTYCLKDRLSQIYDQRGLYATEGAAFGPLLGSSFTFPKKPEFWTLAQLESFRAVQLDRVKGDKPDQLLKVWSRLIESRKHMLGEYYALRQHPFIKTPEAVKAEFLEREPAIAHDALAMAVDWTRHELVLAGHDLYWAVDALLEAATCSDKPITSCSVRQDIPLLASSVIEMPVGDTCSWPLLVDVTRATKTQYVVRMGNLACRHSGAQEREGIWLTTKAGHEALKAFLTALVDFCRHSLLARVSIAVSTPGGVLSLESRPLEGIVLEDQGLTRLLVLDVDKQGSQRLKRVWVAPVDAYSTHLPDDARYREALVEEVLSLWTSSLQVFPFSFEDHLKFICPLVNKPTELSLEEEEELLGLAKLTYPVVDEHVQKVPDGAYIVTRHDMTSPILIAKTSDVEFAIGLALAHEVSNPWRLGLVSRPPAA